MVDPQDLAEDSLIEEEFLFKLKANGLADETLRNYYKAVKTLEGLDKDPKELEEDDIDRWSVNLQKEYAEASQRTYKACVKKYLKWVKTGDLNGEEYPDCVKNLKVGKGKKNLPKEILSHEEVRRIAEVTDRQRDRAMVWVGYESGCRPGELLEMEIKDVELDRFGAQVMVDGKTGQRRIRLVESVPDLKTWLSMHPRKDDTSAYIWRSREGGNLGNRGWAQNLERMAERAGIKKHVHPHLLRHSRATHLAAKGINESQMREIFGWTKNSDMPSVYVHLSGRDTDSALLNLYGIEVSESDNQLEMGIKKCSFCGHENSPNAKFCEECNGPLDSTAVKQTDEKLRNQEGHVQELLEFIKEKHPRAILDFYEEKEKVQELQKLGESKAKT